MRPFSAEAAEQVISLLCYSRTDDRYHHGPHGKPAVFGGAFRLARAVNEGTPRLALSDSYDPDQYRTITIADAIKQGLLNSSWEDFATKLYLNDQDILYMCLMSREEPVPLRLNEAERVKTYRDQHNDKTLAAKFTYMPRPTRSRTYIRPVPRNTGSRKEELMVAHPHVRAKAS
jgi:hypothetical protein